MSINDERLPTALLKEWAEDFDGGRGEAEAMIRELLLYRALGTPEQIEDVVRAAREADQTLREQYGVELMDHSALSKALAALKPEEPDHD